MLRIKQITLLSILLILTVACHHSDPSIQNGPSLDAQEELSDDETSVSDSLSVGINSDSLLYVSAFPYEGKRVLVLPNSWPLDSLTAFYNDKSISVQERHQILSDTNIRIEHSKLPSLFIVMDENDKDSIYKDKSQVAYAFISILMPDGTNEYEGEVSIKTRGNTSWKVKEKKPFTIKLSRSTRLMGLEKGKSFSLLNVFLDNSYIRNAIAFRLSNHLGIFAPDFAFISLYLNGNYLGVYQMTNKIEVSRRSVDIVDLEKENKRANQLPFDEYPTFSIGETRMNGHKKGVLIKSPDDITGGYRLDYNGGEMVYESCISGFVSHAGDPIRIKSPKHASIEQVEYISNYYDQLEAAVMNPTGYHPETGKHYSEYMDIESFARYFLIQEITQNLDGGWCSFMMYKDAGDFSKMMAGPSWDFDRAMWKSHNPNYPFNRLWSVSKTIVKAQPYSGGLLYWLWQHEDFQSLAKSIFLDELFNYINDSTNILDYTDSLVAKLSKDVEFEQMKHPKSHRTNNYEETTKNVSHFLLERNDFLHWLWTSDSSEIVAVSLTGDLDPKKEHFQKEITLYGNKTDGVTLPEISRAMTSYRDPIFLGYYILGTDILLDENKPLMESQSVEIRWDFPNWFEALYRRVKKKIKKILD